MAKTKLGSNAIFGGTQLGITTILDRVYAYSGSKGVASSDVKHLDFTTGKGFIVCEFIGIGATLAGTLASGAVSLFTITFNGVTVGIIKTDTDTEDMPSYVSIPLLIPPLTSVIVNVESDRGTSSMVTSCQLIGRIYA